MLAVGQEDYNNILAIGMEVINDQIMSGGL